jgi:hypothetical protein
VRRELFPPPPGGRLGAVAPVPFVGTAAILVALIVFTPVLVATGPSAIEIQPVLSVYRASGASATSYHVHGADPNVPYPWLNISLGTGFTWSGSCPDPSVGLTWSYSNGTNTTGGVMVSGANPVVVNVTVVYAVSSGRTVYAGELAFDLVSQNSSSESLLYVPCPWTPAVSSGGSWTVSLGTLPIDLVNYGSGGPT